MGFYQYCYFSTPYFYIFFFPLWSKALFYFLLMRLFYAGVITIFIVVRFISFKVLFFRKVWDMRVDKRKMIRYIVIQWIRGRVAEGAPLLRVYGVYSLIEGSNPSVSAILFNNINPTTTLTSPHVRYISNAARSLIKQATM